MYEAMRRGNILQKQQRITIVDVARKAGVGTTTVSRVINGGKLVAPPVKERIEAVIRQLGYQPSQAARALAQERTRTIGLIVPRLTDSFFATIASVVQSVCRAQGYTLLISTSSDAEDHAVEELQVLERHRVEGLIIVPTPDQGQRTREYCQRLGRRVVSLDLRVDLPSVSSVQSNNRQASADATRHLIQHGRKRILFLSSDPRLETMRERRAGYKEALAEGGLKPLECEQIDSFEATEAAILKMRQSRGGFDGLLTANSTLGIHAFKVLENHAIAAPSEVGLITFGSFTLADTLRPSLTCVAQPTEELGRTAAEILFKQLRTSRGRTEHVQMLSQLLTRESCGCTTPR